MRIGIDEVGRGCLAGPVTVSAALVPAGFREPAWLPELRDSKIMTRLQREAWCEWVKTEGFERGIIAAVSSVSPAVVDRVNIARAANLAAWRSLNKILDEGGFIKASVVLDGCLFLKSKTFQNAGGFPPNIESVKTVTGADKKFKEVKIAAIMAKVARDAYMERMAERYPEFGFGRHKGYGTRFHLEAIGRLGPIEGFHRKTFLQKGFPV
jgi:ribonuclease HII